MADQIEQPNGTLTALGGDIESEHQKAATSTVGELAVLIDSAPESSRERVSQVLATALCASGSLRLFGEDGVQAYNDLVDGLRAEYVQGRTEIMSSDCGVSEATYPSDDGSLKTPEEIANLNEPVNGLDSLEALAESVVRSWNAGQDAHRQVDLDEFDAARDEALPQVRADKDRRNSDGWRDDDVATGHLYGDNVPDEYAGYDDPYENELGELFPDENGQIGKSTFD